MLPIGNIQLISAPSILGLTPSGVEKLAETLLSSGLAEKIGAADPVIHIPTLNLYYSSKRDTSTKCLNPETIQRFSIRLSDTVVKTLKKGRFAFVLGGDCSILIGIAAALRTLGHYGLIFLDAHADFYEPEKSITGEVADMDLAIVTGRGPEILTNIKGLKPYIDDEHVIHIGQRDREETQKYGSQDILKTSVACFSLEDIQNNGVEHITTGMTAHINELRVTKFWIHFDTDVLSDEVNPAVDYRLPGGLAFEHVEYIIRNLLLTGKMAGISVTIFNPELDPSKKIAQAISDSLGRAFN